LKIDINQQDNLKNTALMYSISHDLKKITKILIKAKADLNIKNSYNQTAVFLAIYCSDKETLRLLLNHYVNLKNQDEELLNSLIQAYSYYESRCFIF